MLYWWILLLGLPLIYLARSAKKSNAKRRLTPRTLRILIWVLVVWISLPVVYLILIYLMLFLFYLLPIMLGLIGSLPQLLRPEEWLALCSGACLVLAVLVAVKRRRGKQPEELVTEDPGAPDDLCGE